MWCTIFQPSFWHSNTFVAASLKRCPQLSVTAQLLSTRLPMPSLVSTTSTQVT